MEFVENVDVVEFNKFVENHPKKSHFLQSPLWGELSRHRHLIPHCVGIRVNHKLTASALLLEKKLPFGYSHFYAPRGFVLDYNDLNTLSFFTDSVKNYVKRKKGIYFKIDPDIKLHQIDKDAKPIEGGENNYQLVDTLKSLGYKHFGYNRNFEGSQPRFTFRINTGGAWKEIESRFSSSTKQRIKKAVKYGVEISIGSKEDIKTFYKLTAATEKRKNIFQHGYEYYVHFYDLFSKDNHAKLFLAKVNPTEIVDRLQQELTQCLKEKERLQKKVTEDSAQHVLNKAEQINKQKTKIEENIELFTEYKKKYPEWVVISAHMIVFYGDKGWVLYAGNHDELTETFANYLVYREHIKYAHEIGKRIYDQFGTVGDLNENNPLVGLHEFKKKFGGEYTEFIGEFTYVINYPVYFVFAHLVPFYRKLVKTVLRRRKKDAI